MIELLDMLEDVRPAGENQWLARCPSHDDRRHSLSVSIGRQGQWLLHCHAGCTYTDLAETLNIDLADLWPESRRLDSCTRVVSRCEGRVRIPSLTVLKSPDVWTFEQKVQTSGLPTHDELARWQREVNGVAPYLRQVKAWSLTTLVRLHVGFDGRRVTFPVHGPDGRLEGVVRYRPGAGTKSLADGRRDLWPAPETVPFADVWLVEGEPDAVSAAELGLPAVALPGVGKWCDSWLDRLRDRSVTVCLDADVAGRACAQAVLGRLTAAGVPSRCVDVAPASDGVDLGDLLVRARDDGRVGDLRAYLGRLQREAWT